MRYSLGYNPDPAHRRTQKDARALLATFLTTAPTLQPTSLAQWNAPIMDQGSGEFGTGSCTGHGTSQALYTTWGSLRLDLPFVPSPDGIYTPTRCLDRAGATMVGTQPKPLTDSGAIPADVMLSLAKYGVRPIKAPTPDGRYSDCTPATINLEPSLADLELSGRKVVTGEYRIDETASDFIVLVQQSLSVAKVAVGIGVLVGDNFQDWNPSTGPLAVPDDPNSPDSGGHWLCIDSWDSWSGGVMLSGPNSWSK